MHKYAYPRMVTETLNRKYRSNQSKLNLNIGQINVILIEYQPSFPLAFLRVYTELTMNLY